MQLEFFCSACNQKYKATYSVVGKTIACRNCGAPITIPGEPWWPTPPAPEPQSQQSAPERKPKPRPARRRSERAPALPEMAEPLRTDIFREADLAYGRGAAGADVYGLNEPQVLPPRQRLSELPEPAEDPEFKAPMRAGISKPRRQASHDYASCWNRLCAQVVDNIIFTACLTSLCVMIGYSVQAYYTMEGDGESGAALPADGVGALRIIVALTTLGAYLLYYPGAISSEHQATLGKRAIGIKVVDLRGEPISFGRAVVRELCKFFSYLTLFFGFLMAAFTPRKQALHDLIAGTIVVRD